MEKMRSIKDLAKKSIMMVIASMLMVSEIWAQRPTHLPEQTPPVPFFESFSNIFFYIIVPLLILILYLIWRSKTKKETKKKEERLKE